MQYTVLSYGPTLKKMPKNIKRLDVSLNNDQTNVICFGLYINIGQNSPSNPA